MNSLLLQGLGWLGFFNRPFVLEQLLVAGLVFAALGQLRQRSRRCRAVPTTILLLLGLLIAIAVAAGLGRRFGLLVLAAQIQAALLALLLVERLVLRRCLPPGVVRQLESRFLRPVFVLVVALVLLDAVASLSDLATIPLGQWFGSEIQLGTVFTVVVVLYLVVSGSIYPARAVGWGAQRLLGMSEGSGKAMVTLLRYGIIALAFGWGFTRLGIDRAGLLAVAGGLSVGLGFGVKEVFSNFISGLWLLVEGSVRPGEVLIHEGEACEVRQLDLRAATLLRTSDNAELVVPNQNFFTATTTTYTRSDRTRRCGFEVTAPSSWPPDRMIHLLEELAGSHPQVLPSPPPQALLLSFSPTVHSYRLSFSITDPLRANAISSEVKLNLWRRFDAEGLLLSATGEGSSSPAS